MAWKMSDFLLRNKSIAYFFIDVKISLVLWLLLTVCACALGLLPARIHH